MPEPPDDALLAQLKRREQARDEQNLPELAMSIEYQASLLEANDYEERVQRALNVGPLFCFGEEAIDDLSDADGAMLIGIASNGFSHRMVEGSEWTDEWEIPWIQSLLEEAAEGIGTDLKANFWSVVPAVASRVARTPAAQRPAIDGFGWSLHKLLAERSVDTWVKAASAVDEEALDTGASHFDRRGLLAMYLYGYALGCCAAFDPDVA